MRLGEQLILLRSVAQRADGGKAVKLSELELDALKQSIQAVSELIRKGARA